MPGSLKATLCRAGAQRMKAYCLDRGLPDDEYGKVLAALGEHELRRLADIAKRAEASGVPDLARLDAAGLRRIEPEGASVAVHSPRTAITDYRLVVESYVRDAVPTGGTVITDAPVTAVQDEGARASRCRRRTLARPWSTARTSPSAWGCSRIG